MISDTHGVLRAEALDALAGSSLIIHAGDVGKPEVLDALAQIAPVVAVRGNNDKGEWADSLPTTRIVEVEAAWLYVLHEIATLDLDPKAAGLHAVISGHSHHPSSQLLDGILYLNPGSAGPRRFKLPVALALLRVSGTTLEAKILDLQAPATRDPER